MIIFLKPSILFGDDEINNHKIKIKDNDTKEEEEIEISDIIDYMEGR